MAGQELETWLADASNADRRRREIDDPFLHRFQRRHFVLYNVLPGVFSIIAFALLAIRPLGALEVSLFGSLWFLTGLGVSAGYHRLFTHRSWEAAKPVRTALAIMGSMAALGPVISWAAIHRRHHECADQDGDLHSPNLFGDGLLAEARGFLHAHLTWMMRHPYPNVAFYTPDLLRDRTLVWVGRHYHEWVLLGLLLPAVLGGVITHSVWGVATCFLWGGAVRMWVVSNSISALNSVLHRFGTRRFTWGENAQERSRNSWLFAMLVWGEGWHNNHHAFPASASFGLEWYRVDISHWLIRLLEATGLAWNVRVPPRNAIIRRERRMQDSHDKPAALQATENK